LNILKKVKIFTSSRPSPEGEEEKKVLLLEEKDLG
jgi:hypothetical protein